MAELSIVKSQLLESERERVRLAELVEESIVRLEKAKLKSIIFVYKKSGQMRL